MKVGIAVPAYNTKKFIEMCLTSLNAQTYPVSIYVVDDCSDDGLFEFLADRPDWYTKLERHEQRKGWAVTLNDAAKLALEDDCDAVFVMASDDIMRLDCIEKCVEAIDSKDFVLVYSQQVGAENVVQTSKENVTVSDLKDSCPLVNYGLIRSAVWQAVDGYSSDATLTGSNGYKEDWEFWIKVFSSGFSNYAVVKEPVYYYIMHDKQLHREDDHRFEEARQLILNKHREVFNGL